MSPFNSKLLTDRRRRLPVCVRLGPSCMLHSMIPTTASESAREEARISEYYPGSVNYLSYKRLAKYSTRTDVCNKASIARPEYGFYISPKSPRTRRREERASETLRE